MSMLKPPSVPVAIDAINDALALLPPGLTSQQARLLLLAIALQESGCRTRRQAGNGPARSLWQGEVTGGMCYGVLRHRLTGPVARGLCDDRDCPPDPRSVWQRIEVDDVLAAGLARLLLFSDPAPLPDIGDVDGAWAYYLRTWRPGRPRPEHWPGHYAEALQALGMAA